MCADTRVCGSTATKIRARLSGLPLQSGMRLAAVLVDDALVRWFEQHQRTLTS
jgi:hypothetical protein